MEQASSAKVFFENAMFAGLGGIYAVVLSLAVFTNPADWKTPNRTPASIEQTYSDVCPDFVETSF